MKTFKAEYPDFDVKIGQQVELLSLSTDGIVSYKLAKPSIKPVPAGTAYKAQYGLIDYRIRHYGRAVVTSVMPRAGVLIVALVGAWDAHNKAEVVL